MFENWSKDVKLYIVRFLRFLKEAMSQNSLRNLFYECFIVGENPFNTFDCTGRQLINFFDVLKMKTD